MTLEWRPYKDKESVFWSQFKKEGDVGLVTKFKGSGDGYKPDGNVKVEFEGYQYWAKEAKGQKGPFWVIERKRTSTLGEDDPEQAAHEAVRKEYQDGAKKGHEENVQMHKERLAKEQELITAIQNLTESVNALIKRMDASEGI